jgi:hypothetical protein
VTAHELAIRPSGSLYYLSKDEVGLTPDPSITDAFSEDVGAGLYSLAVAKSTSTLPASFRFWQKVALFYLNERCHQPQTTVCEALALPRTDELEAFVLAAPPMLGAEYVTAELIASVWLSLDQWLCTQVNTHYNGQLNSYLSATAPHWHQVGRVCFHLAENKQDQEYPFAFMATYAAQMTSDGRTRFQSLNNALKEYAGKKNKQALIKLLTPIDLASRQSTLVKDWLETGDIYHPLAWTAEEAYGFIQEVPLYEESGIIVRLPDWWKKRARPQVTVSIGNKGQSFLNTNTLLDFEIHTVLGDNTLTNKEWQALLGANEHLVLFKGQWVEVDRDKLNEALSHWQAVEKQVAQQGISFAEGMRLLAGMPMSMDAVQTSEVDKQWAFVDAGKGLKSLLQQLRSPESISGSLHISQLKATLRPYQEVGAGWLVKLSQLGLGACLADDMGLGKTIQVIALLLTLKKSKSAAKSGARSPSLLVLPASLVNNWKEELEKFAPSLRCHFVHSAFLPVEEMKDASLIKGKDLIVTTYGMLSRQAWLQRKVWHLVILDEAQAIKNANTLQSKTVRKLQAHARIALTGTPIENRLTELWSLFDFLCPGLLGNASVFKRYVKSLDGRSVDQYASLRALISPYILRRLKSDKRIISDLPDKTEVHSYCGLSKKQAVLYEASVKQLKAALEKKGGSEQNSIQRRGLVLSYLLRFKQICNHPSQWLGDTQYSPEFSGKFTRLAELAEEISARQEKVLVFTQFRGMTQVLADFLEGCFGRAGLVLHGGTSIAKRKSCVDQFQREDGPPFFVLSIKAGGTGLNLTAASHVIHFDRWWNPAVENQATDRAYRIGQKRNVLVHKFVCKGTIEEKIDAMIREKSALADELLQGADGGGSLLTELNNDELIRMVSLDVSHVM